ncbi:MAG TPA: hypothetical protein VFP47_17105 [Pyrinomonadaceae bacterium]|nr:hypothetical protein [Pyrinomonadaceae bacterium]
MCRSIGLLALLFVVSHPWFNQGAGTSQLDVVPRPVKQTIVETPSSADISFEDFEFLQLWITNHPGHSEIKGEPTKGFKYSVRARIYGEDAISTAKFEAIDQAGNVIQKILIQRQPGPSGDSDFFGVMKVPDRPFRVVLSGEGIDGKSYRLVFRRLFKPTLRRKSPIIMPSSRTMPAAAAKRMRELIDERYLKAMDKEEDELRRQGGKIVMPRTRVSNVRYAPYLSKAGRPLGLRIMYDVEFSQDGYHNPELELFLDYQKSEWRGRIDVYPLTGSIEPQPAEAGSPQDQPHILSYGAGYLYRAGTTYHFTVELVPDYVIQNKEKTKFCIYFQKFKHDPLMQVAFKEILASKMPTKYSVHIANTAFYGEIEGLHSQNTVLESYMAEGAQDCGEQPTDRF